MEQSPPAKQKPVRKPKFANERDRISFRRPRNRTNQANCRARKKRRVTNPNSLSLSDDQIKTKLMFGKLISVSLQIYPLIETLKTVERNKIYYCCYQIVKAYNTLTLTLLFETHWGRA